MLCKSAASLIYAIVAAPLVLFTTPKTWVKVACVLLLLVSAYPMLRTYDIVPVRHIVEAANSISPERKSRFEYRIENEDKLLAKANQKPFFGWGTWGRNRVYASERETMFRSPMGNGSSSSGSSGGSVIYACSVFSRCPLGVQERRFAAPSPKPVLVVGGLEPDPCREHRRLASQCGPDAADVSDGGVDCRCGSRAGAAIRVPPASVQRAGLGCCLIARTPRRGVLTAHRKQVPNKPDVSAMFSTRSNALTSQGANTGEASASGSCAIVFRGLSGQQPHHAACIGVFGGRVQRCRR